MNDFINFPKQAIPFSLKTKKWRKLHLDWADSKTFFNYSLVRKSSIHKKINYDLLTGKVHMLDIQLILNPSSIKALFIPDHIQHYPIMNSKLNVLRGEESKRIFDVHAVVTNPTAISQIEENKKQEVFQSLQELIAADSMDEQLFAQAIDRQAHYFLYEWLDIREIRANAVLNHYYKELNMPLIFNDGFMDAMAVGEEIYMCDIEGGEPVVRRMNPLKLRIFKSGYSNKIEDADVIIVEDYWSPGRIIDTYYDVLSERDIKYIEEIPDHIGQGATDEMANIDERYGFVNYNMLGDEITVDNGSFFSDPAGLFSEGVTSSLLPYDLAGNVRVIRLFWKSKRRVLEVTSYDLETGEEVVNFYPETYKVNKDAGEKARVLYINEAWEGTKIGSDIYVDMRPRVVQYNRMSNPSRCHFGIIGSIYNLNETRPYSLVDMMKSYNYLYDAIHDRLNKALARNWGKMIKMDLSKMPAEWDVDQWMYYGRVDGILFEDGFNEGLKGAATGKLAGALNNNSNSVVDAEVGDYIQLLVNLLEFIKNEMSEVAGISKLREGQISNRETVGGVERATLQSSHITEWLFLKHDDVKKRVLEAFLETAKIAMRGKKKKFQYILPDAATILMDIDGDEFAECDYGIVVDNSSGVQELNQKIETYAQAALLNQFITFSTTAKLYQSTSMAEKIKMIEIDEMELMLRLLEQAEADREALAAIAEQLAALKQAELDQKERANIRDNETKLIIAGLTSQTNIDRETADFENQSFDPQKREELLEKIRLFNVTHLLKEDLLSFEKEKSEKELSIKRLQVNKPNNTK